MILIPIAYIGGTLGGIALLILGYVLGRRAKLAELHRLQRDGILTITYHKKGDVPPTMRSREADEHLEVVGYERRDSKERRDDWAKHLMRQPIDTKEE